MSLAGSMPTPVPSSPRPAAAPDGSDRVLAERLLAAGVVAPHQLAAAEELQRCAPGRLPLAEVLVRQGIVSIGAVQEVLAAGLGSSPSVGAVTPRPRTPTAATPGPFSASSMASSKRISPAEIEEALADPARRLGRYVLVREIGRGGMGIVYRGHDPDLRRDVAVKVLREQGDKERQRFLHEARAAARLSHPGIVRLIEVGEHAGDPYIVMDYVRGETLAELVERDGVPPPRRLAELVRETALALAHAHAEGVVHRDVKPHNILIDRADGRPRLVDFGLARTADAATQLTVSGQLIGTPHYVAPEQARGGGAEIGPRSDVYSLGAVLYWGLLGRPPFDGETLLEVLGQVFRNDPEPPRRIDPSVHPDLETIAMRCLEKQPSGRYESAGEVAEELRRFLDGEAIRARPLGRIARARRWARRNPARVAAGALAGLLAVGGPAALAVHAAVTASERARAARAERSEIAGEARARAERAWEELERHRAALPAAGGPSAQQKTRAEALDRLLAASLEAFTAADRVESITEGGPAARDAMFRAAMALGETALLAEQWSLATSAFERARGVGVDEARAQAALDGVGDARRAVAERNRTAVQEVLERARAGEIGRRASGWEDAVFELVRYPETQTVELLAAELDSICDEMSAAVADFLMAATPTAEERARGLTDIAGLEEVVARWTRLRPGEELEPRDMAVVNEATRRQIIRARGLPTADGPLSIARGADVIGAAVQGRLGRDPDRGNRLLIARMCVEALGRIGIAESAREALARYLFLEFDQRRAIPAGVALLRLGGAESVELVRGYANRCGLNGPFWQQVSRYVPSDALVRPIEEGSAVELIDRALTRIAAGEADAAIEELTRAIELEPRNVEAWANRGTARLQKGDGRGAIADLEHAFELDPADPEILSNIGLAHRALGDLAEAVRVLRRAVELDPTSHKAWNNLGLTLGDTGDLRGGIAALEQAVRVRADYANAYLNLSNWKRQVGDLDGAVADATRAIELDPGESAGWNNRAAARAKQGDLDGALGDVQKAIDISPGHVSAWNNRGLIRMRRSDVAGSVGDFSRAVELDPGYVDGWYNRGVAYYTLGQLELAEADFTRTIEKRPDYVAAWLNRGSLRGKRGDLDGALADLERAVQLDPREPIAWFNLGMAHQTAGRSREAVAAFRRVIEVAPGHPKATEARARIAALGGG